MCGGVKCSLAALVLTALEMFVQLPSAVRLWWSLTHGYWPCIVLMLSRGWSMQRNARKECSPGGKTGNTFISTPPSESALRETQTHLKSPEPSNVAASLEADGLQPLVQAAFNGAQSTNASSNNCNPLLCHAVWPQSALPATWERGILGSPSCWRSSELERSRNRLPAPNEGTT